MWNIKRSFFSTLILTIFFAYCTNNTKNKLTNTTNQLEIKPQTEIKIVGQWLGQGNRERLVREFVKEYNFLNQDVKVILKFPEEIVGNDRGTNKLNEWTISQLKAEKSEFDILMINNVFDLILNDPEWAKKYLIDFSDFEEFRNNTKAGLIQDSIKRVWGGIIPGPFIEGYYYTFWCNTKVAEKVGIEVKQLGMTFDDFVGYIKAVHQYNQTHPDDYTIPIFEARDWKTLSNLMHQLYISKLNDRNEYFADEVSEKRLSAWHETLKELYKLSAYKPLCPQWDTMAWSNNYPLMLKNKCLFFSNGSWMYNFWHSLEDNENLKYIMPTEYPVCGPVDMYIGGYQIMWVVPKNAPHKDEAIKLLLSMNSAKVAEKWIRYTKCPTGIKGKLASVNLGIDKIEDFTYKIQEKYGENKVSFIGSRHIFGTLRKRDKNYGWEVLQGLITPEDAMARIRDTLRKQNAVIY